MERKQTPLIILLDIDGTVVGDVTHQVAMYDIVNALKQKKVRVTYGLKDLQDSLLLGGLIRPNFKCFIDELSNHGVEFFVYTAAEKTWAEYIVKNIESVLNIKFNRPLFTRTQCISQNNMIMKSIAAVTPAIAKTLRAKQYDVSNLENKILAIDNNSVFIERDHQILCDTYTLSVPVNVPSFFPRMLFEMHTKDIMATICYHYPYAVKPTNSWYKFQRQFYMVYVQLLGEMLRVKQSTLHDPLFKMIRHIIMQKNPSSFTPELVRYMQRKLSEQAGKHINNI